MTITIANGVRRQPVAIQVGRIKKRTLLIGCAFLSFASWSIAGSITGQFTGAVTGTRTDNAVLPGAIIIGMPVTGAFQFSNDGQLPHTTIASINEARYVSVAPGSFFRIVVGGLTWESGGVRLSVRNDSPVLNDDLFSLGYSSSLMSLGLSSVSFPGVPVGLPNSSFGISLFDSQSPYALIDDTLLPSQSGDLNLAAISGRSGSIFGNVDGSTSFYQITFSIDSLTLEDIAIVPEPSSQTLAIACVACVVGAVCVLRIVRSARYRSAAS